MQGHIFIVEKDSNCRQFIKGMSNSDTLTARNIDKYTGNGRVSKIVLQ